MRTFPVGDGPVGIALSPDGSSAYVTNYRDDTVSVIDTELAEAGGDPVVATIPIPLGNPSVGSPPGSPLPRTGAPPTSATQGTTR